MKKLNEFIGKIGSDKVMHFLVGMVVVANFSIVSWEVGLIGLLFNILLQLAKEKFYDKEADYQDLIAGTMGGILEVIISGIICMFILK